MMRCFLAAAALCASFAFAAPVEDDALILHRMESRQVAQTALPTIKLPYGTWQATSYEKKGDYYIFKNIRFAAPATGALRYAKPAPPAPVSGIQNGKKGGTCMQTFPPGGVPGGPPAGLGPLLNLIDIGEIMSGGDKSSEDCLFLDLYVPAVALKDPTKKLPITNYIYGGAYLLGAKNGPYEAKGIMQQLEGRGIFVSGNYRVGNLGFLPGPAEGAVENAGLWDQRALLEWIQQYASLFGGDANNVSVWGESAGAGSIMHHLVSFGGKKKALFNKAVIQSPANDAKPPVADLKVRFQAYEKAAGCAGKGIACLRTKTTAQLKKADDAYAEALPVGVFGYGPTPDGDLIPKSAPLMLQSGAFQKIDSVLLSHVADEAESLTTIPDTATNAQFTAAMKYSYGSDPQILSAIEKAYPPVPAGQPVRPRFKAHGENAIFSCNHRYLAEAYGPKASAMQFSRGNGYHGTDIGPTFFNPDGGNFIQNSAKQQFFGGSKATPELQFAYRSYLISHALTGNPNTLRDKKNTIEWPVVEQGPLLGNTLNVTDTDFALIKDTLTPKEKCDFWRDIFASIDQENQGAGLTPPVSNSTGSF